MALELLTPFTKVELEEEKKRKQPQTDWDFRREFQSYSQCTPCGCRSSSPAIRIRSGAIDA